ncbi:MAG TPA: hypothetical protein VG816_09650 [Solirubrobacterales bacterium]|nr:hypothetical protein [Solirubrobacterales bacterium]
MIAAPAQAARIHHLLAEEVLPDEASPNSIAINQTTHHFFVTSFGRPAYHFDPNGKLDAAQPELPDSSALEPGYVAVDSSGGAQDGYIYASSPSVRAIQQYDSSGTPTAVKITGAAIPPNGAAQAGGLPPVVNNGDFSPRALAVGPNGNIFTGADDKIDEFTPAGAFVAQFSTGPTFGAIALAIDASGNMILGSGSNTFGSGVYQLNPAGECVPVSCEPIADQDPNFQGPAFSGRDEGVAVDRSTGRIIAADSYSADYKEQAGQFGEFTAAGDPLGRTYIEGPADHYFTKGIAVDEASGKVIVAVNAAGENAIRIYGPVQIVPDAETEAAGSLTDHSATFHGKIGAAEAGEATCAFQYVDEAQFQAHHFDGAAEAPCEPGGPFSGSTMNAVEAQVSGLRGGTTYHYRLVGTNSNGFNAGEDLPFTTHGPAVAEAAASEIGESEVTFSGLVDPRGGETTYAFQYVTQAQFEVNGFAEGSSVPSPPATVPLETQLRGGVEIGSQTVTGLEVLNEGALLVGQEVSGLGIPAGTTITALGKNTLTLSQKATASTPNAELTATGFQPVSERVVGLSPDTTYHFRLTATSISGENAGSSFGEEVTFSTFAPPEVGLPDNRAYEQSSPTEKGGAAIQGEINAIQTSTDGSRITFASYAGIPGGEGQQQFASYMASRATGGWSTRGMLPPASYGPFADILGWDEDLADVYTFASGPGGPTRLLDRSSSDYALREVASVEGKNAPLFFAGASAGGAVALLESQSGELLPEDLPGKQNVYAYDRETGGLVVAGVMNDLTVPPGGAIGGPYDWYDHNSTTSVGGGADRYFTEATHAISTDGRRIFFTAGGTGQLYVRQNPLAPQSPMNGEECAEATKACTIRISAPEEGVTDPGTPAAFTSASADGSVVYFLDTGKLTTDSTAGKGYDLYRYDLETGRLIDLTVDTADKNGAQVEGVLGASASGEGAYFVAKGALAAGAEKALSGETNLYALHGEDIEFIAQLSTNPLGEGLNWIPRSAGGGNVTVANSSRVSADGTLLFISARQLSGYRNHGVNELYLFRMGEGISCVSCDPSGGAPGGPAGVQKIPPVGITPSRNFALLPRNLSADGKRVFFDSPDRLVSADENNVNDVYEWEAKGEGSCESEAQNGGCLFLISAGKSNKPSWFGDADVEGKNVFLFTEDQLVAQDRDELVDVYDARVNGGIAAQNQRPAPSCEGEACLGQGSAGQTAQTPGTSTFSGPGNSNTARPPACAKGRTRKHGRCVKQSHAKKKHQKQKRAPRAKGGSGR